MESPGPASTPHPKSKRSKGDKEEMDGSATKRPRSLFQTPTPRTKAVKKESDEEEDSAESDHENLANLEAEDKDLFKGRFASNPGSEAAQPLEAPEGSGCKEQPEEKLEMPPARKDEPWESLDSDMKDMLQKVQSELLDQLPNSNSPKLC